MAACAESPADCPGTSDGLYARLRTVGLDAARVYHVRDASIHHPNLDLTFDDGTIAFTEDVCGRITGAFFVGDGEVLVQPPNHVERASLSMFTGTAILEEQFASAYFRFNDNTAELLQPFLSPATEAGDFLKDWGEAAHRLAEFDATRLFVDFSHFLPPKTSARDAKFPPLLHAHLLGRKLGAFEIFWDAAISEPLWAGQAETRDGADYFDIWTSFAPTIPGVAAAPRANDISISSYRIRATVNPPTELQASADLDLRVRGGGQRTLLFELSRYLKISSVEMGGHALDFIQNPAIEGTQLRRKGNDLVAVVLPAELKSGQETKLSFHYAGDVLSDAGGGLLYVGARGIWYPNFGLSPAQFDLTFRYPAGWTLLATGKQSSRAAEAASKTGAEPAGMKSSHWISDRPIPVAGFNLGKYVRAEAKAGTVAVEAYGTRGVEKSFPMPAAEAVEPLILPESPRARALPPVAVSPPPPSPARDVQFVADRAAEAIRNFAEWFGPFPFPSLALTQMPGDLSQGWPGLIFLSSTAFLGPQEQHDLHIDPIARELNLKVLAHETAHQWWGDLVLWKSYRDQWISEGLANYAALLLLERQNPAAFHQIMEKYRNDLLSKNKDGELLREAGPVTLGQRLISSHFPDAYEEISYERGTWLFHMLRCMMRDSEMASHSRKAPANPDEPFFRALRKARDRYAGKAMSTRELVQVFEEELPRPLWYQNHHNLNWFLESWINGTAIPELSVRDVHLGEKAGAGNVSGLILQKHAGEDLITAVPVYGVVAGNSLVFLGETLADGPETPFQMTAPAGVHKIVLDPYHTILSAPK